MRGERAAPRWEPPGLRAGAARPSGALGGRSTDCVRAVRAEGLRGARSSRNGDTDVVALLNWAALTEIVGRVIEYSQLERTPQGSSPTFNRMAQGPLRKGLSFLSVRKGGDCRSARLGIKLNETLQTSLKIKISLQKSDGRWPVR